MTDSFVHPDTGSGQVSHHEGEPIPPHLVALDVDGTIVDFDNQLSERVREIVRQVAEHHHIVISTGRSLSGALDTAHRLGLTDSYLVCSNGAVVAKLDASAEAGWTLENAVTFNPAPALKRMTAVLPDSLYLVEEADLSRTASAAFPADELAYTGSDRIATLAEMGKRPVTRIVLREPNASAEEFAAAVEQIGLHGLTYSVGWSNWLDIAPEGVHKASGLEFVRERLGVSTAYTVCAGDGNNDWEMMEWATHGIAMGDAGPGLRALASVVTDPVSEDGLATALAAYFDLPAHQ